jgi:alpha-beta hydrolase superfamily lysophospholipase
MAKTALFITGAWMHTSSWDKFRGVFAGAGYETMTPAWPGLDGTPAALRDHPPEALKGLGLKAITDHYARIIGTLSAAPLIIGHSFGGLITQLLLDRGLGAAGIAFDPGPIAGIVPGPVSLLAATPPLFKGPNGTFTLTRAGFGSSFANTVPVGELPGLYDAYVVPTPARIFYEAALMQGTRVRPAARTQPLLITAADRDRTVTPYLARAAYSIQRKSPARTDFRQFADRSHFLCNEAGWEEVAGAALDWARAAGV